MALDRLTARNIPEFLTKDPDTARFIQSIIDQQAAIAGGATAAFTSLSDTFASYAGFGGYSIKVKADASGLEAVAPSSGSTVFTSTDQVITASGSLTIPH